MTLPVSTVGIRRGQGWVLDTNLIHTLFSGISLRHTAMGVKKFTPLKLAHRPCSRALLAALLALLAFNALADVDPRAEFDKKIKSAQVVSVLGPNLAGDSTNLYTGSTSFSATDVSLPGAVGPGVAVGRTYAIEAGRQEAKAGTTASTRVRLFGDWDLDIPYISGVYSNQQGWDIDSTTPLKRCSVLSETRSDGSPAIGTPRPYPVAFPQWYPTEFWSGTDMHLPGGGSQTLLMANVSGVPKPTTGGPYHWTSKDDWWFSCLDQTINGGTIGGEAFVALSPNGDKYTFDFMTSRWVGRLWEQICMLDGIENPDYSFGNPCDHRTVARKEFMLLPTRIEDRFGNWVVYNWSTDAFARLNSIVAKDGRTITLSYNASGFVSSVTDGSHTWTYQYSGSSLTSVVLPDGTSWQYSFAGFDYLGAQSYSCQDIAEPFNCYSPPMHYVSATAYAIHPSGARVDFTVANHFKPTVNGMGTGGGSYPFGLISKSLSGPGIATATWTFSYAPTRDEFKAACAAGPCPAQVTTEAIAPDGSITRSAFGIVPFTNQGLLLSEQSGKVVSGAAVFTKTALFGYASPTGGSGFTVQRGTNPMNLDPALTDSAETFYSELKLPVNLKQTTLQGVQFAWQATAFDAYARPTATTKASTGNDGGDSILVETMSYKNDTAKWVIGLPERTWCWNAPECNGTTGREMSFTDYNASSLLPWRTYSFGISGPTFAYNTDGTLATVTDGRGNTTAVGSWYRGVPRLITWPAIAPASSKTRTAVVSPVGEITGVTDELSNQTLYSYDSMSRVSAVTYPVTGQSWNALARGLASVAGAEYGIPAGHWRETIQTGNGKVTTFYNALWQPAVVLTEDAGNVNTRSFVVNRYDAMGRKTFTSYPVLTLTTVNDTLKGVLTAYDELGRATGTQQDSELVGGQSMLTTSTQYLSGFRTSVTNPRGISTTTSYKVFDSPSSDMPVKLLMPEGVITTTSRQSALGKPVSIKREGLYGGTSVDALRSYIYDSGERLCKSINPESGATLVDYDAAGNIAWSAEGTSLISLVCDRTSVSVGQMNIRAYDSMNRVSAVTTPGNVADIATTYEADGLVRSLTASNPGGASVVTEYFYNNRRMLLSENSSQPGWYLTSVGYGYDANGHASSLTYPDMQQVTYAPDALGRPTQVGTYATGISYYPNGAMRGFTYGNGLVRTMTQNARLLPATSVDKKPDNSVIAISDTLSYDPDGNVLAIVDGAQGGTTSRTMAYDGLDRLTSANSPGQWGTATYAYDPLDNLRVTDIGGTAARQYRYTYSPSTNLLTDIKTPLGATVFGFAYDARGNQTLKGGQGYQFDVANRLTSVTGKEDYRYDGMGRRVFAWSPPGTIMLWQYAQDGRELYASDGRRSQNRSNIYLGNTVLATRTLDWGTGTVNVRYLHTDALGSPVAETGPTGAILKRNSYEPFGAAYGGTSLDGIGYTGHVMDQATGLTYMQQRYYDPAIGAFLSVDPMAVDTKTAWNFGRYNYASDSPYRFKDPDGRASVGCQATNSCPGQNFTKPTAPPSLPQPVVDAVLGAGSGVVTGASLGTVSPSAVGIDTKHADTNSKTFVVANGAGQGVGVVASAGAVTKVATVAMASPTVRTMVLATGMAAGGDGPAASAASAYLEAQALRQETKEAATKIVELISKGPKP